MFKLRSLTVLITLFLFFLIEAYADTVYLKNGQSLEGLINKEDKDAVELNVGYGTVIFKTNEIERIYRSTPQETQEIRKNWTINKTQTEQIKPSAKEERDRSSEKWAAIVGQVETERTAEEEKRQIDANAKTIPVTLDSRGHVLVDAVLNESVHASLVIDTGCPVVLLTANMAQELGIDLESIHNTREVMVLNGNHKVGLVLLKSVKLGDLEEKNIETEVLLEDDEDIKSDLKDGLLGLSFLKRFDVALDQKNRELIFKKTH